MASKNDRLLAIAARLVALVASDLEHDTNYCPGNRTGGTCTCSLSRVLAAVREYREVLG